MIALLRRLRCAFIGHNYRNLHGTYWCIDCREHMPQRRSS